MTTEGIAKVVQKLRRRYQEDDPERLCLEMDILLRHMPMGKGANACKGFFLRQSRIPLIMLNSDQPQSLQRVVLAHELGHANFTENPKRFMSFSCLAAFSAANTRPTSSPPNICCQTRPSRKPCARNLPYLMQQGSCAFRRNFWISRSASCKRRAMRLIRLCMRIAAL